MPPTACTSLLLQKHISGQSPALAVYSIMCLSCVFPEELNTSGENVHTLPGNRTLQQQRQFSSHDDKILHPLPHLHIKASPCYFLLVSQLLSHSSEKKELMHFECFHLFANKTWSYLQSPISSPLFLPFLLLRSCFCIGRYLQPESSFPKDLRRFSSLLHHQSCTHSDRFHQYL